MTDPIADLLTRIRNASAVKKSTVVVPYSRMKQEIIRVLKEERYIEEYETVTVGGVKSIQIALKYVDTFPVIRILKKTSKPGCRKYVRADDIPTIKNNYGIAILSTSRGIMTNRQARKLHVGGELICEIS
jgi:small subunit ribosomal protein S8